MKLQLVIGLSFLFNGVSLLNTRCTEEQKDCFSSEECCAGLACFANSKKELRQSAGSCLQELTLHTCISDLDCFNGQSCSALGAGQYCVDDSQRSAAHKRIPGAYLNAVLKGRLGMICNKSEECHSSDLRMPELCCKEVNRGRQGVRTQCDHVSTPSPCI